jgi:hypothetical protein
LGTSFGGPAEDIEKLMIDVGLDDSSPGSFLGPGSSHPRSDKGITWMINGNYRVTQRFSAGVIVSKSDFGTTHGYRDPSAGLLGTHLRINYSALTFAPIVSFQINVLRFGLGPALHITKSDATSIIKKQNKFGFLIDVGLTFPENSRFFIEFRALYRVVGKVEIGPYDKTVVLEDPVIIPKTEVDYNHLSIGIGLGFRL